MLNKLTLFLTGLLISPSIIKAQDIRINEAMSSNVQTILDEEGDTPDWFEIYNYGETTVNLEGISISDHSDNEDWWTFPPMQLDPNQYLIVFASDKDRKEPPLIWNTVVDLGDEWSYLVPESEPSSTWRNLEFDDSSWEIGKTSIGYGDGDDSTVVNNALSVFLRKTFEVADPTLVSELLLHVDYDDGFIAYLNGTEIARNGLAGTFPAFDATASSHESVMHSGGQPETFAIDAELVSLLNQGSNVLCVQVHNTSANSSDMTIIPFLSLGGSVSTGEGFSEYLEIGTRSFHTDFKISSSGDSLFLRNANLEMIDTLVTGNMSADISFGWSEIDTDQLVFFNEPTPGAANSSQGYSSISGNVDFDTDGGIYSSSLDVSISTEDDNAAIYYTTDGSEPTASSTLYSGSINISFNTVLRARTLDDTSLPGPITTASYLINVDHDLPIISISADPYEFFDPNDGMYVMGSNAESSFPHFGANFWQDWERPVHVEMYEPDGELAFEANAGAKIFGGWSRGQPQKSLSLFFRKSYGDGPIDYQVFPDKELTDYSSLVLRNSGNDWDRTMLRDGVLTSLFHESVDRQYFRPSIVYINGEYFGIHNIREKINEHFLANNHSLDPDSVELMETNSTPIYGNEEHYVNLINYVTNNNLSVQTSYDYVATQMDIQNFIFYMSANIYIDNQDWPGNNIKFWRETRDDGKWKWIAFDTDFGFGIWEVNNFVNNTLNFALSPSGPDWPNPPWSTLLLRRLMENETFQNQFINSIADQFNSTWATQAVHNAIDEKRDLIASEMQRHYSRWGGSVNEWNNLIDNMHTFGENRQSEMLQHVEDRYGISGQYDLTLEVSPTAQGKVRVNTLSPEVFPWVGKYFNNVPITLEAIANTGFEFVRWEGISSTDPTISFSRNADITIRAVFQPTSIPANQLVINEINYNGAEQAGIDDWVELYNNSSSNLDISNWVFKDDDDNHEFIFPTGTNIPANGYLVVCRDALNFSENYTSATSFIGDLDFGLSSDGDCIRIFDDLGELIDQVCYQTTSPWPEAANGLGSTLALRNPSLENQIGSNWYALSTNGNPGESNVNAVASISETIEPSLVTYPNPFHRTAKIQFTLEKSSEVKISVIDLHGQIVETLANTNMNSGSHTIDWTPTARVKPGLYFVRVSTSDRVFVSRILYR